MKILKIIAPQMSYSVNKTWSGKQKPRAAEFLMLHNQQKAMRQAFKILSHV